MDKIWDSSHVEIRRMGYEDIPFVCKADNDESERNVEYLNNQLANQENNECSALLALYDGDVAGYVFLYYKCRWGSMANCGIPAVVDWKTPQEGYRHHADGCCGRCREEARG